MASKTVPLWVVVLPVLIAVLVSTRVASAQVTEPPIRVTKVTGKLALHNTIAVEVQNLSEYLAQPGKDARKFSLYLDWRRVKGVNGRAIPASNRLLFDVRRTPESKTEWDALLGRPLAGGKGFTYLVSVSVGYEDQNPVPTEVDNGNRYPLLIVDKSGFWIFAAFLASSLLGFMWLAKKRNIIRDPCPDLPTTDEKPYSLGRTQMAFWFFMVAASYVSIWMITGDRESITESTLGLLGISAATAVGAQIVSSSKSGAAATKRQSVEADLAALKMREDADAKARQDQLGREIGALDAEMTCQKSEGFLIDILSDANGISLHRFQMAVWTVVLGLVFVVSVYNSLSMPQFGGTLLALMGISGGTYIGFKFPERQA